MVAGHTVSVFHLNLRHVCKIIVSGWEVPKTHCWRSFILFFNYQTRWDRNGTLGMRLWTILNLTIKRVIITDFIENHFVFSNKIPFHYVRHPQLTWWQESVWFRTSHRILHWNQPKPVTPAVWCWSQYNAESISYKIQLESFFKPHINWEASCTLCTWHLVFEKQFWTFRWLDFASHLRGKVLKCTVTNQTNLPLAKTFKRKLGSCTKCTVRKTFYYPPPPHLFRILSLSPRVLFFNQQLLMLIVLRVIDIKENWMSLSHSLSLSVNGQISFRRSAWKRKHKSVAKVMFALMVPVCLS